MAGGLARRRYDDPVFDAETAHARLDEGGIGKQVKWGHVRNNALTPCRYRDLRADTRWIARRQRQWRDMVMATHVRSQTHESSRNDVKSIRAQRSVMRAFSRSSAM